MFLIAAHDFIGVVSIWCGAAAAQANVDGTRSLARNCMVARVMFSDICSSRICSPIGPFGQPVAEGVHTLL